MTDDPEPHLTELRLGERFPRGAAVPPAPATPSWIARLVRLGRRRTMLLLTAFSVLGSVLIVAGFTVLFHAPREDLLKWYLPAVVVPLCVAPIVIHLLLDVAYALDAAHLHAARQQRELQRGQQLELVGRLASALAHELNNVLTVVRASVEALGGAAADDDLAAIDEAAQRGARITRRLLAVGRHDEIVCVRQPIAPVLHDIARVVPRLLPASIRLVLPPRLPDRWLDIDADAVQQALLNLVLNARDAIEGEGRVTIAVDTDRVDGQEWLRLSVADTGHGMNAELLARATDAFVTTKAAHEGTGLGLTIVQRTMEQHGGRLGITSAPNEGTRVELAFPVPPQPDTLPVDAPAPPNAAPPARAARTVPRVLLVDDETEVRTVTTRVLERAGFQVVSVGDALAARRWLAEHQPVEVIVTDVMMPGTTGLDLLQQLRDSGDRTPVLLVSGFTVERLEEIVEADRSVRFLAKPWTPAVLTAEVSSLAIG